MTYRAITIFGKKIAILTVLSGFGVAMAGCGVDGVELHGGVFDAMGISSKSMAKAKEPQLKPRHALVVPPDIQALPAPGSGNAGTQGAQNWPQDPEELKRARAAQEKRNIAKYCDDRDWWERSKPEEFNRKTHNGDLCQSSLGKKLTKGLRK